MISKQEIMEYARIYNLPPNTIEKDYVLNWILAGIAQSGILKNHWVFKGGTCLKKCFFELYRFSEDLDFTIIALEHRDLDFLKSEFVNISEWIYERVKSAVYKCDEILPETALNRLCTALVWHVLVTRN